MERLCSLGNGTKYEDRVASHESVSIQLVSFECRHDFIPPLTRNTSLLFAQTTILGSTRNTSDLLYT